MRNLTSVTLSNNYFHGTLPAWLGELEKLQVISMGTFAGYDESTGAFDLQETAAHPFVGVAMAHHYLMTQQD